MRGPLPARPALLCQPRPPRLPAATDGRTDGRTGRGRRRKRASLASSGRWVAFGGQPHPLRRCRLRSLFLCRRPSAFAVAGPSCKAALLASLTLTLPSYVAGVVGRRIAATHPCSSCSSSSPARTSAFLPSFERLLLLLFLRSPFSISQSPQSSQQTDGRSGPLFLFLSSVRPSVRITAATAVIVLGEGSRVSERVQTMVAWAAAAAATLIDR